DHAGAADPVLLGEGDPCPGICRHACCPHPAGAAADHEQIVVECHDFLIPKLATAQRRSRIFTPSSPAMMAFLQRPMNRPCSTTPTRDDSALASRSGSSIAPIRQS